MHSALRLMLQLGDWNAATADCWSIPMDTLALLLRYGFLAALLIEALLVGRALLAMLRERARASAAAPAEE